MGRPKIMKHLTVGTLLLTCLLAGCEVSVKPATPDGSNDTSLTTGCDPVVQVQAINTFEAKMATLRAASKGSLENRRPAEEGLRIAREINPYYPNGVDPELAAAIRLVKEAEIKDFEDLLLFHAGSNKVPLLSDEAAVGKACDDYNEVRNRMVIKYKIRVK
jgi:hypothetical protein